MYACFYCDQTFESLQQRDLHDIEEHLVPKENYCQKCKQIVIYPILHLCKK